MPLIEEFAEAQAQVNGLKSRPSNEQLLDLYALYKQATVGDASGKRPGMLDLKGRAKFDSWEGRKGMSKDAAMTAYVALARRLAGSRGTTRFASKAAAAELVFGSRGATRGTVVNLLRVDRASL